MLSEKFATLDAAGEPPMEEEKLLHLTDSIGNDKLETGCISHIVADSTMSQNFNEASNHLLMTASHMKIIGSSNEDHGGGSRCSISFAASGGQKDLTKLADGYIDRKKWSSLSKKDHEEIQRIRSKGKKSVANKRGASNDNRGSSTKKQKEQANMARAISSAVVEALKQFQGSQPEKTGKDDAKSHDGGNQKGAGKSA